LTPQDAAILTTGQMMTIAVLLLNLLFVGWVFIGVRRNQRDLSDIRSSLKHIIQALPHGTSPELITPQTDTPVVQLPDAETSPGPQTKSAANIMAFIAARQAGHTLQEAAQRYDLTEDEALAISISYRDATPVSANNNAIS
jgi:hypothetical protein